MADSLNWIKPHPVVSIISRIYTSWERYYTLILLRYVNELRLWFLFLLFSRGLLALITVTKPGVGDSCRKDVGMKFEYIDSLGLVVPNLLRWFRLVIIVLTISLINQPA